MASQILTKTDKGGSKCYHVLGKTSIDLNHPPHPKELLETVKQDDKVLIIPMRKPREQPVLFKKAEYERLLNKAHVVTAEAKEAMIEEVERVKKQKETESNLRKEALKQAKLTQELKEGRKLTLMEAEAQKKTAYLLKRAFDLRQEQEDEVKHANQLVLASKCLAIRAAQVKEKELIKQELDEEEQRLYDMMEEQRRLSLQKEEEERKEEHKRKQRFVSQQMQQIHEREIEKLMEGERLEEEARLQNRAIIQMQRDEEAKRQKLLKKQEKMRLDLHLANEEILKYKQIEKEENRIADLRVQEFMRKKAEREAALEEEHRQQQIAKEKETARLRAMQEKQADLQAQRDEMNAIRVQEEVEKAWRLKEKNNAIKKKQEAENLKKERALQVDGIRRQQALALEREKQEFFRIVAVQKAEFEDTNIMVIDKFEIIFINQTFMDANASCFKISRKEFAVSVNLNIYTDHFSDTMVELRIFALYSNEYRPTGVNILRSLCDFMGAEYLWITEDVSVKYGNMPRNCPWTKGLYYVKNYIFDATKMPEFAWNKMMVKA